MPSFDLIRSHELAFRTQYAELKERVLASGPLLPGTPGTLIARCISGRDYWYRVYYPVPGRQSEDYVGSADDSELAEAMGERIAFAQWVSTQVRNLKRLDFQVGSKPVARVLVELYNKSLAGSGLVLVGTQAYMTLINELGIITVSAMTMDVDLAVRKSAGRGLKPAAEESFLQTLKATRMPFGEVPGLKPKTPATSAKLPGVDGLRIDLLTNGPKIGEVVAVPRLQWHAQTIPHYNYLLKDPERAAVLAGDHCIPVYVPQPARFVWHKLYASLQQQRMRAKAEKDRRQALILARALSLDDPAALAAAFHATDPAMRKALRRRLPGVLEKHELGILEFNRLA